MIKGIFWIFSDKVIIKFEARKEIATTVPVNIKREAMIKALFILLLFFLCLFLVLVISKKLYHS